MNEPQTAYNAVTYIPGAVTKPKKATTAERLDAMSRAIDYARGYASRELARLADRCDGLAEQAANRIDQEKRDAQATEKRITLLAERLTRAEGSIMGLRDVLLPDDPEPEDEDDEDDDEDEGVVLDDEELEELAQERVGAKIVLGTLVGFLLGLIVGGFIWAVAMKAVEPIKPLILT